MKSKTLHATMLTTLMAVIIGWVSNAVADTPPTVEDVQKWVVNQMVSWAKPGTSFHRPAMETFEEGKERYAEIAEAVLKVAAKEEPVFVGKHGRYRTLALVLSISMFESSYRKDVDLNLGNEGRGDGGGSWCLMQIQLGPPVYFLPSGKRAVLEQVCTTEANNVKKCRMVPPSESIPSTPIKVVLTDGGGYRLTMDQSEGYSGQDLVANRELCFTTGLRMLRKSLNACSALPALERLSAYASGNCSNGRSASRQRMGAAVNWLVVRPPPSEDPALVQLFN